MKREKRKRERSIGRRGGDVMIRESRLCATARDYSL